MSRCLTSLKLVLDQMPNPFWAISSAASWISLIPATLTGTTGFRSARDLATVSLRRSRLHRSQYGEDPGGRTVLQHMHHGVASAPERLCGKLPTAPKGVIGVVGRLDGLTFASS